MIYNAVQKAVEFYIKKEKIFMSLGVLSKYVVTKILDLVTFTMTTDDLLLKLKWSQLSYFFPVLLWWVLARGTGIVEAVTLTMIV